jgi:hypothetical protein
VAFSGTIFAWSRYALTPLQRYYLGTYLNCTLEGSDPAFSSEVRWLYKTAPRGAQELVTDQDVVPAASSGDSHIPMRLSSEAQNRGWTGLAQGPEEWLQIARLESFLQSHFYARRSLWRMLLSPLLWSVAILFLLLAGEDFFRSYHAARRRDMKRIDWGEPPPSLVRRWRTTIDEVHFRLPEFRKSSTRRGPTKAPPVAPAVPLVEPQKKPSEAPFSLFGSPDGTRREGFVWNGKNEIN